MSKEIKRGRGRPDSMESGKQIAAQLALIGTENAPSRFLAKRLEEKGFVAFVAQPSDGKRGRPRMTVELTGRGKNLLNLAKNWN